MVVPLIIQWLPVFLNYLIVWASYALSRRSVGASGKLNVRVFLGIIFILSCLATMAGLIFRDQLVTSLEISMFGGTSGIWTFKYGKAVIREGHEMYARNAPGYVHILMTLLYLILLCWPTYTSARLYNNTALLEEKIEKLKK